jgi:hypothetical protein
MDGYKSIDRYEIVDSVERDKEVWPDSAVFQFTLTEEMKKCTQVSIIQAAIPNILYNVSPVNNRVLVIHKEFKKTFLVKCIISPGHYDVYTFAEELERLLNNSLSKAYETNEIDISYVYRDTSGNQFIPARIVDASQLAFKTTDPSEVGIPLSSLTRVQTWGRYTVQFIPAKGRLRIYFSENSAIFTMVFAFPKEDEIELYTNLKITPEDLSRTPYILMGFSNHRNYSNEPTLDPSWNPVDIGLEPDEIDTTDVVNYGMIMSVRYMNIFHEPYVYFHILEFVMDPSDIPTSWYDSSGNPNGKVQDIFNNNRKLLTKPLGKILITTLPGEMVYYNYTDYPNTLEMFNFYSQTFKDISKLTCVWTKKDGTLLNFDKIDVQVVLQFITSSAPHDEVR